MAGRFGRGRSRPSDGGALGAVLSGAGYGKLAAFWQNLPDRGHIWALGIPPAQTV
jgi:hypothetical protein